MFSVAKPYAAVLFRDRYTQHAELSELTEVLTEICLVLLVDLLGEGFDVFSGVLVYSIFQL